jgi:tripartite-type tricarboxylate transporter receptor subunit TctC
VTSDARSPALPDIPAIAEFVPGYAAIVWNGMVAPKNTPVGIIDQLNSAINASLGDGRVKAQFGNVGSVPKSMTPLEFGKFVADDTTKWGKIIHGQHQGRVSLWWSL